MRVHALVGTIVLLGCAMTVHSQAKSTPAQGGVEANVPGTSIIRLDPALDSVLAPDAKIERVATGFKFIEGPMWRQGRLWFSDLVGNKLYAVSPAGKLEMLKDHSGGLDSFPPGAYMGSNAMATDKDHSVLLIEQGARKIVRLDKDLKASLFLEKFEGKHLNSPNDLVFATDGSLWFTDPPYGLQKQNNDPAKELSFNGVYR
jgi:gluconolactonase